MTFRDHAPRAAWLTGILLSFAMAGLIVVIFLLHSPSTAMTYLLPALLSGLSALVFAVAWPTGSWRWGLVMSSGFAIFFLVVFLAYLSVHDVNATTLVRAASVVLAGLGGSAIATRLRGVPRAQRIGD